MDNDLIQAKAALSGHSLVLVKGERQLFNNGRGISPMMEYISAGEDLSGFSAADIIVGRAAALLFVYAGIKSVYAETISRGGAAALEYHHVHFEYKTMTESIINRTKSGLCPMESALGDTLDPKDCYEILAETLRKLKAVK